MAPQSNPVDLQKDAERVRLSPETRTASLGLQKLQRELYRVSARVRLRELIPGNTVSKASREALSSSN